MDFKNKYLNIKKYINLKKQLGGNLTNDEKLLYLKNLLECIHLVINH